MSRTLSANRSQIILIKRTDAFEYFKANLKENSIYSDLSDDTLNKITIGLKSKKWKKGDEFFSTSGTSENFYIIISGRIKIFQINHDAGHELTVFLLQKHDVFDIISLLDPKKKKH